MMLVLLLILVLPQLCLAPLLLLPLVASVRYGNAARLLERLH
jgi:hypothetical protein